MIIATRVLALRRAGGDIPVPVRLDAPEQQAGHWSCRFEIGWPDRTREMIVRGEDAMQALELALRAIGALLYTSDHHAAGTLLWRVAGRGYGFPVPASLRPRLIGDDRRNQ